MSNPDKEEMPLTDTDLQGPLMADCSQMQMAEPDTELTLQASLA